MRLAREWALANDGALITDHDYLDRLLHLLESRYHNRGGQDCFHLEIPLQVPTHLADIRLQSSLPCGGEAAFVSSSPSSIRPSMPCSPCWAAATPNPPC